MHLIAWSVVCSEVVTKKSKRRQAMLKTVAAIAAVAAIPMLFVGCPSAVAQEATDADWASAASAGLRPQATTPIRKPIAYGYINTDGTVASGSGNFTSVFDPVNKWYAIKITSRNYFFTNFSTVVTPSFNSAPPRADLRHRQCVRQTPRGVLRHGRRPRAAAGWVRLWRILISKHSDA
jgi:hypothetical protein